MRNNCTILTIQHKVFGDCYLQIFAVKRQIWLTEHHFVLFLFLISIHIPRSAPCIVVAIAVKRILVDTLAPNSCISDGIGILTILKPPLFCVIFFKICFVEYAVNCEVWHTIIKPNIHHPFIIIFWKNQGHRIGVYRWSPIERLLYFFFKIWKLCIIQEVPDTWKISTPFRGLGVHVKLLGGR